MAEINQKLITRTDWTKTLLSMEVGECQEYLLIGEYFRATRAQGNLHSTYRGKWVIKKSFSDDATSFSVTRKE
jgi:D-aminopeptidase